MKCLIIQGTLPHLSEIYTSGWGLKNAFENFNISTDIWGPNRNNFNIIPDFKQYDIIFLLENYWSNEWLPNLSNIKAFKIMWIIDDHVIGLDPYMQEYNSGKYDLICCASYNTALKTNSTWLPLCACNKTCIPLESIEKQYSIGFCGTLHNRRFIIDILKKLNFNIQVDENKWGEDMVKCINSYHIHLNKNISSDINFRNFETIACKTILLTEYNYMYNFLGFKNLENCIIYNDAKDLILNLHNILTNQSLANQIRQNGYELSKRHTYIERVKHILNYIKI